MALFPPALVGLIDESSSDPEETVRALRRHDLLGSTVDDAEVLRLIREALAESAVYVRTSPYDDKGPGHFVAFALLDAGCLSSRSNRSPRQRVEARPARVGLLRTS